MPGAETEADQRYDLILLLSTRRRVATQPWTYCYTLPPNHQYRRVAGGRHIERRLYQINQDSFPRTMWHFLEHSTGRCEFERRRSAIITGPILSFRTIAFPTSYWSC